ncbi:MAG: CRISPR system precrRNA processing endoribonuclease RAMP protein Cas6, partial [Endomicrobium sp.]|nr:CRISPR system precrRNA processing endoribonuclease RAMP protein Cas6 [Endomicrobium sp.]
MLSQILISKYKFNLKASQNMRLPSYKASMFRGGFGHIFKSLNCVDRISKECLPSCQIKNSCIYAYIFNNNGQDIPRPYVIATPFGDKREFKTDETFSFDLILFGKAAKYLPHFIFSFIELGKAGLTSQKYNYRLESVLDENGNALFKDNQIIPSSNPCENKARKTPCRFYANENTSLVTLNFTVPLRLKVQGDLITKLKFEDLIKAITRRINAIAKFHCDCDPQIDHKTLIEKAKNIKIVSDNLQWQDWTRFSSRQKTTMEFGGLVGEITFKGDLPPFMPYLELGSKIHIGKECVFGLGKYDIIHIAALQKREKRAQ